MEGTLTGEGSVHPQEPTLNATTGVVAYKSTGKVLNPSSPLMPRVPRFGVRPRRSVAGQFETFVYSKCLP
jgi:hypothetical protein